MFGSTILDVAAGIIFGFLAISLFTSAAVRGDQLGPQRAREKSAHRDHGASE